ncbi:hypothetical protein BCR32DRAFT_239899 [Anaeromyces robustus]|uniref:Uncharacterized protein n=1 Tax=Anaeromyces robustus TaxID=1754192 RepID=A0A1Y1XR49_9FUNG|nr:hypothetical protein BCR32DRAFT_239899 [Anaeromyces robustus]|eukprot:ORX87794.1 hypothetical protein BCR32DRAFT_239899 [Anaeromyces robustus]
MNNDNNEIIDLINKKNEIINLVKKYCTENLKVFEGENKEWIVIEFYNNYNKKFTIDIANEITIFFMGWHAHYQNNLKNYEMFIEDINYILNNQRFIVNTSYQGKPTVAYMSETNVINIDEIRDEVGDNKEINCCFWDSQKNQIFQPLTN